MSLEQAILEEVRALPVEKQQEIPESCCPPPRRSGQEAAIQEREGPLGRLGDFALRERDRGEPARNVAELSKGRYLMPAVTVDYSADPRLLASVRLGISLDGSTPEIHDTFRGLPGAYARTIQAIEWANEAGIPIQVHTTISRHNAHDLDSLCALFEKLAIVD